MSINRQPGQVFGGSWAISIETRNNFDAIQESIKDGTEFSATCFEYHSDDDIEDDDNQSFEFVEEDAQGEADEEDGNHNTNANNEIVDIDKLLANESDDIESFDDSVGDSDSSLASHLLALDTNSISNSEEEEIDDSTEEKEAEKKDKGDKIENVEEEAIGEIENEEAEAKVVEEENEDESIESIDERSWNSMDTVDLKLECGRWNIKFHHHNNKKTLITKLEDWQAKNDS